MLGPSVIEDKIELHDSTGRFNCICFISVRVYPVLYRKIIINVFSTLNLAH